MAMEKTPATFILQRPEKNRALPVVMDAPHAGNFLPRDVREKVVASDRLRALLRDSFTDIVISRLPQHGISTLVNPYDRIFIDLNSRETTGAGNPRGLGLIARTLMDEKGMLHPIFNKSGMPDASEIADRIKTHYRPYYAALNSLMEEARSTHGFALHFNLHSSPRVTFMDKTKIADIVLGNRNGTTCSKKLTDFVADFFSREGLDVRLNQPFKGGALIEAMGRPDEGWHSLQIELARDLYMVDNTMIDPGKMVKVRGVMAKFAQALGVLTKERAPDFRP